MPYGAAKTSHRTSSIVQIIFYFWSFEISGDNPRIVKLFLIPLQSSDDHNQFIRVTDEDSLSESLQYDLLSVFNLRIV